MHHFPPRVTEKFPALLSKQAEFENVMAELLRICKVPNWWNPATGGHDYIYCGMLAQREIYYNPNPHTLEDCFKGLEHSIAQQDKVTTLFWVLVAPEAGKGLDCI